MDPKVYFIDLALNHPDGIYHSGDRVKIYPAALVNSRMLNSGQIKWELFDNFKLIESGTVELGLPGAAISFTAEKPGGYQCKVTLSPADEDDIEKIIGVVVDPEKITKSWSLPDDFDQFWDRHKARLAAVPMTTELTSIKAEECNVFDLQISCVDNRPVSGLFAMPTDAKPASCPAVICLHGAGVRSAGYNDIVQYANRDFIALNINAHGIPNLEAPEYYEQLLAEKLEGYTHRNFYDETADNIYFVNMFLRVKRAIEFMVSRPEWDGKNLFLVGGSQGAFQTFAGAYLDDRVTAIATGVPAGSNMPEGGWPFCCGQMEALTDAQRRQQYKNAQYVDNVSFASKLKIPVAMTVGLIDETCPSNGVYAVYNAYQGPKVIFAGPEMPHAQEPALWNRCLEYLHSQKK
jgi:cephalosporin-C deacetylase